MKQINYKPSTLILLLFFSSLISGCVSIPNSPTPRFYMITAINEDTGLNKTSTVPGLIIGVGPVKIPDYLNRPQIVTLDQNKMLHFAQFDRWGETLDQGIERTLREDLTVKLPEAKLLAFPWNPAITVKYQIAVEIIRLDSDLQTDLHLVVQWMIIDPSKSKTIMIKQAQFHAPIATHNYAGLVKALSQVCEQLSANLAGVLGK